MEIVGYSSSKGAISVGVNFNPMYRHKIFRYEPIKEFCVFKIKEATEKYGRKYQFRLDGVGAVIDHIHILVTFGPNTKFCDITKVLKEYSAKAVFKAFPWLRGYDKTNILGKGTRQKLFTKGHFWSGGYYFESYGRKTFDSHKDYVANQGKHHEFDKAQTKLDVFVAA